jgi:heat shock protein HslJ
VRSPADEFGWPRNRLYHSTQITEGGRERPGTRVELHFNPSGQLNANAGCNLHTVMGRHVGNQLGDITVASTTKACDGSLAADDAWLIGLFESEPTFSGAIHVEMRARDVVIEFLADLSPS